MFGNLTCDSRSRLPLHSPSDSHRSQVPNASRKRKHPKNRYKEAKDLNHNQTGGDRKTYPILQWNIFCSGVQRYCDIQSHWRIQAKQAFFRLAEKQKTKRKMMKAIWMNSLSIWIELKEGTKETMKGWEKVHQKFQSTTEGTQPFFMKAWKPFRAKERNLECWRQWRKTKHNNCSS